MGWVIFRTEDLNYLKVMFISNNSECYFDLTQIINAKNITIIIIAILFSGIIQVLFNKLKNKEEILDFYEKYLEIFVIFVLMFICIMMLASSTYNPFIYFRF